MSSVDCSLYTKEAQEWVVSGKQAVGTVCCYLPEEVFHAAGLMPIRLRATGTKSDALGEVYFSSYSCPWARATLTELLEGDYGFLKAVFSTNGCMQSQRIFDNAQYYDQTGRYYYLFNSPRLIDNRALDFYKQEMIDLIASVEKFTGKKITDDDLRHSAEVFNETRRLIKRLYDLRKADNPVISGADSLEWTMAALSMPREVFNQKLTSFLESATDRDPITGHEARIILVGSAMDDPEYMRVVEDAGCIIVGDVTCFGSRSLWEEVETKGDIKTNLAQMYLRRPACPRMVDTQRIMMDQILSTYHDFRAQGIVYVRQMNCDPWGSMRQYFDEYFTKNGIPYIEMEKEEVIINAGQVGVRVGALVEMLDEGE
jgi:bzd-type benzoyl-CoA reductase N subunit